VPQQTAKNIKMSVNYKLECKWLFVQVEMKLLSSLSQWV
jgi:hypothetical protein